MIIDELGEWTLQAKLHWWDAAYQHYYIHPSVRKETSMSKCTSEVLKNFNMRQFALVDDTEWCSLIGKVMKEVVVIYQKRDAEIPATERHIRES